MTWRKLEQWAEDANPSYGDYAHGTAHIALYGHSDGRRFEVAYYTEGVRGGLRPAPQGSRREYMLTECDTGPWLPNLVNGNDDGRDSAEIVYSTADARTIDSIKEGERLALARASEDESHKLG